jgi:hypothetical protein
VSSCWPYAHDKFEDEVFTENAQNWDEVVQRMANLKMTRFKAIRMDEHEATIEHSTQDALRAREENRVTEATKVQGRGSFLTLEAQTKGMRLMAEAHRVIDQLQNYPYLVEMTTVLANNPIKSWEGPSDPELVHIERSRG